MEGEKNYHAGVKDSSAGRDKDDRIRNLRLKLYVIEQELDRTDLGRRKRERLNYRRISIRRKLRGGDPRFFADIGVGGIPEEKREAFQLKKVIVSILDTIGTKEKK